MGRSHDQGYSVLVALVSGACRQRMAGPGTHDRLVLQRLWQGQALRTIENRAETVTVDTGNDTWRAVALKANTVIEACRSRLEQNEQSQGESQFLRGQIAAMREILGMATPAAVAPLKERRLDRSGI
jgi:hypothetical protein